MAKKTGSDKPVINYIQAEKETETVPTLKKKQKTIK